MFSIDKSATEGAAAIADVAPSGSPAANEARGAVGISDEDGMLEWIELLPEDPADPASSEAMLALLEKNGCSARGLVTSDVRAFLGGSLDIGGDPAAPTARRDAPRPDARARSAIDLRVDRDRAAGGVATAPVAEGQMAPDARSAGEARGLGLGEIACRRRACSTLRRDGGAKRT